MADWNTPEGQDATKPLHVLPLNDIREHVMDGLFCPCLPRLRKPEPIEVDGELVQPDESHDVIVHNSYDRREVGEVCRKALDQLGVALADHGHQWNAEQRWDYEHAIHVLNMHWPAKESGLSTGGDRG